MPKLVAPKQIQKWTKDWWKMSDHQRKVAMLGLEGEDLAKLKEAQAKIEQDEAEGHEYLREVPASAFEPQDILGAISGGGYRGMLEKYEDIGKTPKALSMIEAMDLLAFLLPGVAGVAAKGKQHRRISKMRGRPKYKSKKGKPTPKAPPKVEAAQKMLKEMEDFDKPMTYGPPRVARVKSDLERQIEAEGKSIDADLTAVIKKRKQRIKEAADRDIVQAAADKAKEPKVTEPGTPMGVTRADRARRGAVDATKSKAVKDHLSGVKPKGPVSRWSEDELVFHIYDASNETTSRAAYQELANRIEQGILDRAFKKGAKAQKTQAKLDALKPAVFKRMQELISRANARLGRPPKSTLH